MNLPDAPIAHEGFFATHFFTVSDQDKWKDFYVRILGGKVIKPDNPLHLNYLLAFDGIIASRGGIPLIDQDVIIGAVGCSRGTDSQDEVVSKAGAAVINQLPARIK